MHALYALRYRYVVHVDAKAPAIVHASLERLRQSLPNLHLLAPMNISWGGPSMLQVSNILPLSLSLPPSTPPPPVDSCYASVRRQVCNVPIAGKSGAHMCRRLVV